MARSWYTSIGKYKKKITCQGIQKQSVNLPQNDLVYFMNWFVLASWSYYGIEHSPMKFHAIFGLSTVFIQGWHFPSHFFFAQRSISPNMVLFWLFSAFLPYWPLWLMNINWNEVQYYRAPNFTHLVSGSKIHWKGIYVAAVTRVTWICLKSWLNKPGDCWK